MNKIQVTLHKVELDKVLLYLYAQVKELGGKTYEHNRTVEYRDGTSRNVVYRYCVQTVLPPQNNRIVVKSSYVIEPESKPAQAYGPLPAIEFKGWQLLTDSVLIKVEYESFYKLDVDNILRDLDITFELNTDELKKPGEEQAAGQKEIQSHHETRDRKRAFRSDTTKKVALALYLLERDHLTQRAAARKARTTTNSMRDYEASPDVQANLKDFKSKPDNASAYQSSLNNAKR